MLKTIRICLAALFLVGITLLFFGIGLDWWGWMAKLQFLPAVLGLNIAVISGILVLTLFLGRIYCSVICPLGVFQDLVIALRRWTGKLAGKRNPRKRLHYKASKEIKWLRYGVLILYMVAIAAGLQAAVVLLAPYSAYGRMVRSIVGIADGSAPVQLLLVAGLTLLVIVVLAWTSERLWCNSICPVGTTLGLISRASIFKVRIDTDKCIGCRKCERSCKSGCIDIKNGKTIDYSRCVDCFECIGACGESGIRFTLAPKKETAVDGSKRKFLGTAALLTGSALLAESEAKAQQLNGGVARILPKTDPERTTPLAPPGARSVKRFYDRCTGCNLCITNCPNGVLKTSTDLEHLLQPKMSFADGHCRPECNTCGTICPAGAIEPLKPFEKLTISIGTARVEHESCLMTKGVSCANCVRHCPVGAIRIVKREDGVRIPVVNEERCIGCGACENLCPVRPLSAITVNGRETHQNNG